jgi:hypothetical protein
MKPENGILHPEFRTDNRAVFYETFCEHNRLTSAQNRTKNGITRITVRTSQKEEYTTIHEKDTFATDYNVISGMLGYDKKRFFIRR